MPPTLNVTYSVASQKAQHCAEQLTSRIRHPLIAPSVGAHGIFEDDANAIALIQHTTCTGPAEVGFSLILHFFARALAKRVLWFRSFHCSGSQRKQHGCRRKASEKAPPARYVGSAFHRFSHKKRRGEISPAVSFTWTDIRQYAYRCSRSRRCCALLRPSRRRLSCWQACHHRASS
jgi:hypothetical protein